MNNPENKHAEEHMHGQEHGNKCGKCGKHHRRYAKLAPFSLAMASGIVYSLSIVILGWLGTKGPMRDDMIVHMLGVGGLQAVFFGFVGGFVIALVFAWLYNACLCCWVCRPKCSKCSKCGCHCCKC